MAKTNAALLDADLDQARMEIQAGAELVLRSMRETYRLIAVAQRRIRTIAQTNAARPARRAA